MLERTGYTTLQKSLHWAIALLVLFMIASGAIIGTFDNQPGFDARWGAGSFDGLYNLHKNAGLTLLALMLVRIAARVRLGAPAYAVPLAAHERILSASVHGALYLLLIAAPVTGWLIISAYPALPSYFGLFPVPGLIAPDRAFYEVILGPHEVLGWVTAGLVALHIGAALFHGIVKKDGVLARMLAG